MIQTNYWGASTVFENTLTFNRPLDDETYNLLVGLSMTRRVKRDPAKLREKYGRDYGVDGEFFYDPNDFEKLGMTYDETVVDSNTPPESQPALWFNWQPTEDRLHMRWLGREKTYHTEAWFYYIMNSILSPRGYTLTGVINANVEYGYKKWHMVFADNATMVKRGHSKKCPIPDYNKWVENLCNI